MSMEQPGGEPVSLWLPPHLCPAGTSVYAGADARRFDGPVPDGFSDVSLDLPVATCLAFRGEPFREEDFGAVESVQCAMERRSGRYRVAHGTTTTRVQYEPSDPVAGYVECAVKRRVGRAVRACGGAFPAPPIAATAFLPVCPAATRRCSILGGASPNVSSGSAAVRTCAPVFPLGSGRGGEAGLKNRLRDGEASGSLVEEHYDDVLAYCRSACAVPRRRVDRRRRRSCVFRAQRALAAAR